ncbi:hypothetical protein V8E54_009313 [Elaphomyces granulatus]
MNMGRQRPIQRPGKRQLIQRAIENPPPSRKRRISKSDDDDSDYAPFEPFMADTASIAVSLGLVISITSSSAKYQGDDGRDDQIFLATTEGDDTDCSRLQELTQLAEYQDAPIVAPIVDEIPSDHEDNDEPPSPAPIQPLPTTNMPPPPIPSTSRSMRPEFLRQ